MNVTSVMCEKMMMRRGKWQVCVRKRDNWKQTPGMQEYHVIIGQKATDQYKKRSNESKPRFEV